MKKQLAIASLLIVNLCFTTSLSAQKQQLSDEQLMDVSRVKIAKQPVQAVRWFNDDTLLLSNNLLVKTKTGEVSTNIPTDSPSLIKKMVVEQDGNIYLVTPEGKVQLTDTKERNDNPALSPDGTFVAFTRENDLYTIRLADKKETRLTFDGSDVILNGYASWAYMEEILGRATKHSAFWWSPDSRQLAFFHSDDSQTPLFTITEAKGKHGTVETWRYPKAGDKVTEVKVSFVQPEGSVIVYADIENDAPHYIGTPIWRLDSKGLWVQWMNKGQDKLALYEVNPTSGAKRQLYTEEQETWVSIDTKDRVRFLESGKGFILQSDKSGWNHLYLHDMNGKLINPITSGEYTVLNVLKIDEKNKTIYFTCYKDNVGCEDFYSVKMDGSKLKRLSFGNYSHRVSLSPNAKYFVTSYSNVSTPTRLALYTTQGKLVAELDNAKDVDFDKYELPTREVVKVKSKDGKFDLPMIVTYPLSREKGKTYPVFIYTYGGPNTAVVRNVWTWATNNNPWLAKEGVIQVTMDHRGSGHAGKVGQNYMHRKLGYWEIEDYKQCVQWLVDNLQADPAKVCISGFSYGGYITCYALAYAPEVFTHAFAGGSVTDWELYDAPYAERFMDSPQENPEGYKNSSVFTHAANIKGMLLLYHGEMDENVHVQQSLQLASKLQDSDINFEMMVYPSERHGWRGSKRTFENNQRTRFIYKYLLEKPIPTGVLNGK